MAPHSLTLALSLDILEQETVALEIKRHYSVIRDGVTPLQLSRAYDRLWDSLGYCGDHRHLEGVTRASVGSALSELQETVERYENDPGNAARLARSKKDYETARRELASLDVCVPVFSFWYGS